MNVGIYWSYSVSVTVYTLTYSVLRSDSPAGCVVMFAALNEATSMATGMATDQAGLRPRARRPRARRDAAPGHDGVLH